MMSCPWIRWTEICRWIKQLRRLRNLHLLRRRHLAFGNKSRERRNPSSFPTRRTPKVARISSSTIITSTIVEYRLPQEDGDIRDMSPTATNASSKTVPVPPRAPPVISSTEPPTPAVFHLVLISSIHTQWGNYLLVLLSLRPLCLQDVAFHPNKVRGGHWQSFLLHKRSRPPSRRSLRLSLDINPLRLLDRCTSPQGHLTPLPSSLTPNCVTVKPDLHKSPPKSPI